MEGKKGLDRLAKASGKSTRTITRYGNEETCPKPDVAYKLALACGFSEKGALKLAGLRSVKGQRTA
jgi:hypothetical protein